MKDSLNHVGFSNTLAVSRKRKKTPQINSLAIDTDKNKIGADDPSRYCPPYMMQQSTIKDVAK